MNRKTESHCCLRCVMLAEKKRIYPIFRLKILFKKSLVMGRSLLITDGQLSVKRIMPKHNIKLV